MDDANVVVADAGPLIALAIAGHVDLLHRLFRTVIIPETVRGELERGKPRPGWDIVERSPWIAVRTPTQPPDRLLSEELDAGEADAIALALEAPGSTVVLDDLRARRLAVHVYGLEVIGTVGVLVRGRRVGLVGALRPILNGLIETGVFLSPALIEAALSSVGET